MGIFTLLTGVFKPLIKWIDELHLSKEEKQRFQLKMTALRLEYEKKALDYDSTLLRERAAVVKAEALGQSWLQRNWRPILMLGFGFIVLNNYVIAPYAHALGMRIPILELPPGFLNLLTVGIGGYVMGRSAEKIFTHNPLKPPLQPKYFPSLPPLAAVPQPPPPPPFPQPPGAATTNPSAPPSPPHLSAENQAPPLAPRTKKLPRSIRLRKRRHKYRNRNQKQTSAGAKKIPSPATTAPAHHATPTTTTQPIPSQAGGERVRQLRHNDLPSQQQWRPFTLNHPSDPGNLSNLGTTENTDPTTVTSSARLTSITSEKLPPLARRHPDTLS